MAQVSASNLWGVHSENERATLVRARKCGGWRVDDAALAFHSRFDDLECFTFGIVVLRSDEDWRALFDTLYEDRGATEASAAKEAAPLLTAPPETDDGASGHRPPQMMQPE